MIATPLDDIRYGFRLLIKNPAYAAIAVFTLAVGIGANTALFSLVDGILFRPLPFAEPDRLVTVWTSNENRGISRWGVSLHDYTDWRLRNEVFEDLGAYNLNTTNLSGLDRPVRITYTQVTPDLITTLGVAPLHGRVFDMEENLPGNDDVILVSRSFWEVQLGGDPSVVGSTVNIDGRPMTVIGIMPASFTFPSPRVQVWKPFGMLPEEEGTRGGRWVRAVARLAPGVTVESAQASLDILGQQLAEEYPETNTGFGIFVEPLQATATGGIRNTLFILWGTAGFVLLIACVNLANLLMARATGRQRELAVRTAIGASRSRLVRQLIAESIPLAVVGGTLGLGLAFVGLRGLPQLAAGRIPSLEFVGIDARVLLYTLGVSLFVTVFFSILPARSASNLDLTPALKEGGKATSSRGRSRVRGVLVVAQVALAMVVVTGAGLLVNSFVSLVNTDPGFTADQVLTVRTAPSWDEIPERERVGQMFAEIQREVASLPMVRSVSAVNRLPLDGNSWGTSLQIEGSEPLADGTQRIALTRIVLPDYHQTLEIPLLRGRYLDASDGVDSPRVLVINQIMADTWWPDSDPLGARVFVGAEWHTIVGVTGTVLHSQLGLPSRPMLYIPFPQGRFGHFQDWGMTFVIRTDGSPLAAVGATLDRMRIVMGEIPLYDVATMEEVIHNDVAARRFNTVLLGLFAVIALLLAAVGIYGVMASAVGQRAQEFGVRLALGATPMRVIGMVLKSGMVLCGAGIVVGGFASAWVTKLLESLLFETSTLDPGTYAAVALVLTGTALAACAVPALRASAVDPLRSMKAE